MMEFLETLFKVIPIALPIFWISGAIAFYFTKERNAKPYEGRDGDLPPISILIPCHNEEETILTTLDSLAHLDYPRFEIIAINDGSRDSTLEILSRISRVNPQVRLVNLEQNRGKAAALSCGLMASRNPFVLCIDADSELDPQAARWMIRHFLKSPDVAAVTGNPIVKNRGTLIGRLQVGEFSVIVGLIKRYQQMIGKLFTVSGVIVMFRRSALVDVGLWDLSTVTEDIGVSWKLQSQGWNLRYEPHALCRVLMPDTLKGLWSQRLRWARGGFETMLIHAGPILFSKGRLRLKLIVAEYFFSAAWERGRFGTRWFTGCSTPRCCCGESRRSSHRKNKNSAPGRTPIGEP